MFAIFKEKKTERKKVFLRLDEEGVANPGKEVAVVACDENGKEISTLCVFEADGGLCLCADVDDNLGLKLNKNGEIVAY